MERGYEPKVPRDVMVMTGPKLLTDVYNSVGQNRTDLLRVRRAGRLTMTRQSPPTSQLNSTEVFREKFFHKSKSLWNKDFSCWRVTRNWLRCYYRTLIGDKTPWI